MFAWKRRGDSSLDKSSPLINILNFQFINNVSLASESVMQVQVGSHVWTLNEYDLFNSLIGGDKRHKEPRWCWMIYAVVKIVR